MAANRTELVARLQAMDAGLEERIERNPDTADPWPEIGSVAGAIGAAAGPQDRDYVRGRIDAILAKHGVMGIDVMGTGQARHGAPAHRQWRAQ